MFTSLQQCERNYVYSYLNFRAKNQQMTRITLQRFNLKKFQISFWPLLFFLVGIFIAWFNDYLAPAGAAHLPCSREPLLRKRQPKLPCKIVYEIFCYSRLKMHLLSTVLQPWSSSREGDFSLNNIDFCYQKMARQRTISSVRVEIAVTCS